MALNKAIIEALNFFIINYCFPKTVTLSHSKNSTETMWFVKIKHSIFYCKDTVAIEIQIQLT